MSERQGLGHDEGTSKPKPGRGTARWLQGERVGVLCFEMSLMKVGKIECATIFH